MHSHLSLVLLLCFLPMGCLRALDPALIGPLTFSFTTQHGEKITRYSGTIPAEETAQIFQHLTPLDDTRKNHLMQETTEATFEYNGVKTPIKWTRVKVSKTMFIFKVRGRKYVLEEPYSTEFQQLLSTYGQD